MSIPIDNSDIYVIIPAYNEHLVIGSVIHELSKLGFIIIIVYDGSEESVFPIVQKFKLFYLRHEINLGQGAALKTGINFALAKNAKIIITFDADGQHNPLEISTLIEVIKQGNIDIVLGSRFMTKSLHIPAARKILLKLARFINFLFTGLLLSDAHNGLRAMTYNAATKIKINNNGMAHATEFLSEIKRNNLKFVEVPVTINYTNYSMQKGQSAWDGFRILFDLIINKRSILMEYN